MQARAERSQQIAAALQRKAEAYQERLRQKRFLPVIKALKALELAVAQYDALPQELLMEYVGEHGGTKLTALLTLRSEV